MTARPSPGDLLIVDGRASVQFAGERALTFRVVSVSNQPTYPGWIWLTGYVLNRRGEAMAKREVYVQLIGLRPVPTEKPQGLQQGVPLPMLCDKQNGSTFPALRQRSTARKLGEEKGASYE